MTIAEMQLGRMRPAQLERHSLAGLRHARRMRRINLAVLIAFWAGIWVYGLYVILTGGGAGLALDRFLPLQVVAALAAVAVLVRARGLMRYGRLPRIALMPAVATLVGAGCLVLALGAGGMQARDMPAMPGGVEFQVRAISL